MYNVNMIFRKIYYPLNLSFFLFLILLVTIEIFVFHEFIFQKKIYLFHDHNYDLLTYYYPRYVQVADYLRTEGLPRWSFNQGLGQNIFPFSLNEPFNWILYAVGHNRIAYWLIYLELLKISGAGIFFYFYLKSLRISDFSATAGSLMYSFCGYLTAGGTYNLVSTEIFYMAFLLFSFEKFYQEDNWYLFPLGIALLVAFLPFFIYIYTIFFVLYLIFRFFWDHGWNLSKFIKLLLKLFGLILLGVLLSSFFLFSEVQLMLLSPRFFGGYSSFSKFFQSPFFKLNDSVRLISALTSFFSNDLLGTFVRFEGTYFEIPHFYSGIAAPFLVFLIFQFLNKKRKILVLISLLLIVTPTVFSYFRYFIWGFSGDYYRSFSLFVGIYFIVFGSLSLKYYETQKKIGAALVIFALAALVLVLFSPYQTGPNKIDAGLRYLCAGFLFVYTILFLLFCKNVAPRIVKFLFLVALSLELAFASAHTLLGRYVITRKVFERDFYNDKSQSAINYLNSTSQGFFRIYKDLIHPNFVGLNDSQIQRFRGISCYNQFNQPYYIRFLKELNVIHADQEGESRWARGPIFPLLQTLVSVKYLLTRATGKHWEKIVFHQIGQVGPVIVLENMFFLPLGFTYDNYFLESEFNNFYVIEKNIMLLKGVVIPDSRQNLYRDIMKLRKDRQQKAFYLKDIFELTESLKKNILNITEFKQNSIKGFIDLPRKKVLFFSIPYDCGWQASIDGKKINPELVNYGFMGLIIERGRHFVELKYEPPFMKSGAFFSLIGFFIYFYLARKFYW